MNKLTKDDLIDKAQEVLVGYQFAINLWGPVLFEKEGSQPDVLKDTAFVVLVGCLRDLAKTIDKDQQAKRYFDSLNDLDSSPLSYSLRQIFAHNIFPAEFLGKMERSEQIFLTYARDRVVHGYLKSISERSRKFTIIAEPSGHVSPFSLEEVPRNEQEKIANILASDGLMSGVQRLRKKYFSHILLLTEYLHPIMDIPPSSVKEALDSGNLIVAPDLQEKYEAFRKALDAIK